MARKVFAGLVTVDVCSCVDQYPQQNEKKRAKRQSVFAGGPAANAAVACRALGSEVVLFSAFGAHSLASLAKEDLRAHGVWYHDMASDYQELPVISAITVEEASGDRSVVYASSDNLVRHVSGCSVSMPDDASLLLVDGHYLEQAIALARTARSRGCTVVLDGGSWKTGLQDLLPYVDYAICSADFRPPHGETIAERIRYLRTFGPEGVAVSRGRQPVVACTGTTIQELAVEEVMCRDTLGAGDILHGAFCHFLEHHEFIESLALAMQVASFSCRFHGTREWIRQLAKHSENRLGE